MYHSSIVRGESLSSYPPPLTPEQQAHFPPLPPQFPRRKNWFDRNWKWFTPTLVIAILCLVGGFIAVLYLSVDLTFRSSEVCKIAVAQATASPAVRAKLGTPLRVGHSFSGSLNLYGTSGDANLEIPVSGPLGTGRIDVVGKKRAGHWTFDTLEVSVDGGGRPIPLADPATPDSPTPGSPSSGDGTT